MRRIRRVAIEATLPLTTSFLMSEMPAKVDRQFSPSQFNPVLQLRIIPKTDFIEIKIEVESPFIPSSLFPNSCLSNILNKFLYKCYGDLKEAKYES